MPFLQVVRTDQPEAVFRQAAHREIAHQLAAVAEHGREAHAAHRRQAAGEQAVEPGRSTRAAHLVTGVDGGIEHPRGLARGAHFFRDEAMRIRAAHGGVFGEAVRATREKLGRLHTPGAAEERAVGGKHIVHG